jgi:translation initiation factor 2 gamma subunit (eIF-2gamma)
VVDPGIVVKDESVDAEQNELQFAVPGGLIGSSTRDRAAVRICLSF